MMYLSYSQLKKALDNFTTIISFPSFIPDCNDVLALAADGAVPYKPAKGPGYLMWMTDGTYTMYGRSENHI